MAKYCRYIFLFICFFFVLNIDVNAALYKHGDCIYHFKTESDDINIKINQDQQGNIKYYHYEGGTLTDANDSRWIEEQKPLGTTNGLVNYLLGWHFRNSADSSNNKFLLDGTHYTSCPKYVHYRHYLPGNYDILFSNSSTATDSDIDKGWKWSSVESKSFTAKASLSSSLLKAPTKSTTGDGATCSQTKVDWLSSVPKVDKLKKGESYCLYSGEDDNGCYIVQIHYNIKSKKVYSIKNNFESWSSWQSANAPNIKPDDSINKILFSVGCAPAMGLNFGTELKETGDPTSYDYAYALQRIKSARYSFSSKGEPILSRIKEIPIVSATIITDTKVKEIKSCDELLSDDLISMLKSIVNFVRILIPIILIALGVIDFGTAVFAGDEDKMKKSQSKFIRRLIIGVVIFIIPNILKLILTIAHSVWPVVDATLCGII